MTKKTVKKQPSNYLPAFMIWVSVPTVLIGAGYENWYAALIGVALLFVGNAIMDKGD